MFQIPLSFSVKWGRVISQWVTAICVTTGSKGWDITQTPPTVRPMIAIKNSFKEKNILKDLQEKKSYNHTQSHLEAHTVIFCPHFFLTL